MLTDNPVLLRRQKNLPTLVCGQKKGDKKIPEEEDFIQVLNRLSIKNEEYILNFQYGLFNAAYPNPNFDKDFILDFDCTTKKVKVIDVVADELKQMNKYIQSKFEDSITNILREDWRKNILIKFFNYIFIISTTICL